MRRRELLAMLAVAPAVWPRGARAQAPATPVRRVGMLQALEESDQEARRRVAAFQDALRARGWSIGGNLTIDYRWAVDGPKAERDAAELVAEPADVLVTGGIASTAAALQVGRRVPIVFMRVGYPVERGWVQSLARPGGNVTGFTNVEPSFGGKWLEILKELVPRLARVAVLSPPGATNRDYVTAIEAAAPALGVQVVGVPIATATDIDALDRVAQAPDGGLIVVPGPPNRAIRERVIATAARHRLPAIYAYRYYAEDGGLLSYGIDGVDTMRRVAAYVDRILRGERAGDLPVQQPTTFELIVNLKTARALGMTVPQAILLRADEVIE
jgi:putative tryptophan/tyrosine transport system substrate-binding protein